MGTARALELGPPPPDPPGPRHFSSSVLDPSSGYAYALGVGDKLRFVGTVDGQIVIDELLGPGDDVMAISAHHKQLLESQAADKTWVMEISDPDGDLAPLRFSNDPDQLVIPIAMTEETIDQAIEQRRPGGNGR